MSLPTLLRWSHNDYYHQHLLRNVPAGATRAIDVGCGTGAFARLLAGRGIVLAILGIWRDATLLDYARSAVVAPINGIMGARYAIGSRLGTRSRLPHGRDVDTAPVRDPTMTLAEVKQEAERHLPGAILRRHIFWRYSLVYGRGSTVRLR